MTPAASAFLSDRCDLLTSALHYASLGCRVLPLRPGGKEPLGCLVPNGLKNASSDESQIRRWWKKRPTAGIGLLCGTIFDALDVDGPEGMATLRGLVARYGRIATRVHRTPRGWHLLFKPGVFSTAAGRLGKGLDTRGAETGYIVAPPTRNASGAVYRTAVISELGEAPAWLVELARGPSSSAGRTPPERVRLALEGERNTTLNREVFVAAKNALTDRAAEKAAAMLVAASTLPRAEAEDTSRKAIRAGRIAAGSARERYRRVPVTLELDPRFMGRSVEAKCIALLICTGPDASAIPGVRLSSLRSLARAASLTEEKARGAIRELSKCGLLRSDIRSGILWLPSVTARFRPKYPNETKAWLNALASGIPRCTLRDEIERFVIGQLRAENSLPTTTVLKNAVHKGEGSPSGIHRVDHDSSNESA